MGWYEKKCKRCRQPFPQYDDMPEKEVCPTCEEREALIDLCNGIKEHLESIGEKADLFIMGMRNGISVRVKS